MPFGTKLAFAPKTMNHTNIKDIYAKGSAGDKVVVKGWIRTARGNMGGFGATSR